MSRRISLCALVVLGVMIVCQGMARAEIKAGDAPTIEVESPETTIYSGEEVEIGFTWSDEDDEHFEPGLPVCGNDDDDYDTVSWSVTSGDAYVDTGADDGATFTVTGKHVTTDQTITIQATVSDDATDDGDDNDVNTFEDTTDAVDSITITLKPVKIRAIQEADGDDGVDIESTLHVLKGDTVTFIAAPDPEGKEFPDNQPVWSGSASGTGEEVDVTFDTEGTFTVTATCANSKSVTVEVAKYKPVCDPVWDFTDRAEKKLGVGEKATLNIEFGTGMDYDDIKPVTWTRTSGTAITFDPDPPLVDPLGGVEIVAGAEAGTCTFTMTDKNNDTATIDVEVVEPESFSGTRLSCDTYTVAQGTVGAGMKISPIVVHPTDVSFKKVQLRETDGPASNIEGHFKYVTVPPHDANDNFAGVGEGNEWEVQYDHPSFTSTNWPLPYPEGSFDVEIEVEWLVDPHTTKDGTFDNDVLQRHEVEKLTGNATLTKIGCQVERDPTEAQGH